MLTNSFRDTVAPYYDAFHSVNTVNAYSGSVVNPYFGTYGAVVFEGGGHADSNDNSVHILELGLKSASFRRVTDPTPLFGSNPDSATRGSNSKASAEVTVLTDFAWAEYTVDHQPTSRHSYGAQDVIGPDDGGARHGTFMRVLVSAGAVHGQAGGEVAHKVDFSSLTDKLSWARATQRPGMTGPSSAPGQSVRSGSPNWTAHVPAQQRIYIETQGHGASMVPRWFDLPSQRYVDGSGTKRNNDQDTPDCGIMFHVSWRNLLIHADVQAGHLRLRCMNVAVDQPSWINAPRPLSQPLPLPGSWSAACWCPDNGRILVGNVLNDDAAVYEIEIPSDIDKPWPVSRAPLPAGQRITWAPETCYKKWSYNPYVRAIVYMPYAARSGDEQVFVYRPRGT
ncbi:hypothetical protein PFX98_14395 [Paucibacter sediminis]|uniref:Uncharacterized protein n=1 Tax=Paucibacter sediminis TaxID=3019553 RepID=A0AA95NDC2_9BURK|nr:hypothetical protein [Paucibacter sp. S2-9]WIT10124.1 hypothetical protein PFX98_14395 [Paucibacter sp. S2-9]